MELHNQTGNKKVVLVGGCFDLLHLGHISFLEQAKKLGDHLIVALESDENVRKMKGDMRPIHTQDQRKRMLLAVRSVDEVYVLPPMTGDAAYDKLVRAIRPQVMAITEGDPITGKKRRQAGSIGARFVIIPKIHTPSTSQLAKLLGLE
ncbi:adenylyltransferase/cytidyltransferase family protein [Patescibacteria group bacterium]|nr:adenylyltransferase/cytidyltransferase family protein [Patescibacteria group bacterium]